MKRIYPETTRRERQKRAGREYYSRNKQKMQDSHKSWCKTPGGEAIVRRHNLAQTALRRSDGRMVARQLFYAARRRARNRGVPFSIAKEDVVIPEFCPVLGIPLRIGLCITCPNSPTIDRVIPQLGYIKGNVCVISHKANTMKSDATLQELELLVAFLRRRLQ